MSYPTAVNDQITDGVTQVNTTAVGSAAGMSLGSLFQSSGQALANTAYNGSNAQQNTNVTGQAATAVGVSMIYSLDLGNLAKK